MSRQEVAPRYAASFQCVGSACPDTCCGSWTLEVDRQTHESWKRTGMRLAGIPLVEYTEPAGPHDSLAPDQVAVMKRTEDGACRCLTEDKLCQLIASLGEAALPSTCSTFPRVRVQAGGRISHYLSPACPEATRLVLSDPNAMDLVEAKPRTTDPRLPPISARRSAGLATAAERADPTLDVVEATAEIIAGAVRNLIRMPLLSATQALSLFHVMASSMQLTTDDPAARAEAIDGIVGFARVAKFGGEQLAENARAAEALVAQAAPVHEILKRAASMVNLPRQVNNTPASVRILSEIASTFGLDPNSADEVPEAACIAHLEADRTWFAPFEAANPHLIRDMAQPRPVWLRI